MVAGLLHPALAGIVPDLVEREDLQAANSLLALGANIARLAGLVSAGLVVVRVGGGWALIGASTLFAIAAVLISTLARRTSAVERDSSSSVIAELREGWGEFRSRQWLWVVVLQFAFLVMALQATWAVLGPVVAKAELGGAITRVQGTGLLFSCELSPDYKCYGSGSTEEWLRMHGVNVIHGGENSLRFTPHFGMDDQELDLLVAMVGRALREGPRRTRSQAA